MDAHAAIQASHDGFSRDALALDCGTETLVVGRWPLFVQMPTCDSEVRRGERLEALLRRHVEGTRNRHLLAGLYRHTGPEMSFAHTANITDLMLRHIAHAGGIRAFLFETVPPGPAEPPETVRDLVLESTPDQGGAVRDMAPEVRFHQILLRLEAHLSLPVAEEWRAMVARDGLTLPVGCLSVISRAFFNPGTGSSVLLMVGFAAAGFRIFSAMGHLCETFRLARIADRPSDLDDAAQQLGKALNALGSDLIYRGALHALLTRGALKVATLLRQAPHRTTESLDPVTGLLRT